MFKNARQFFGQGCFAKPDGRRYSDFHMAAKMHQGADAVNTSDHLFQSLAFIVNGRVTRGVVPDGNGPFI